MASTKPEEVIYSYSTHSSEKYVYLYYLKVSPNWSAEKFICYSFIYKKDSLVGESISLVFVQIQKIL